jgi:hypothetical protein
MHGLRGLVWLENIQSLIMFYNILEELTLHFDKAHFCRKCKVKKYQNCSIILSKEVGEI